MSLPLPPPGEGRAWDDANVRIVDMRQSGYPDGHVPGAVYLSPVAIRDAKAPPTFLPTPAAFEEMMVWWTQH